MNPTLITLMGNVRLMCKTIIPTNVLGPHDNYNLEDSHVLPGLTHKYLLVKQNNSPFIFGGTGKLLRQFIYHTLVTLLSSLSGLFFVLVGEEDEASIKDVDLLIPLSRRFHLKANNYSDTSRAHGQFKTPASNDKLKKYLPDFEFTPFDLAVKESVEKFVSNFDQA
ncbi:hypothetical protein BCR42DRAFT_392790 [Absidia repens]|uniref:Uncharacterized protein n=1 Tax=Absidia repens TaxID=90262 RepID=A0A1X2IG47_9FUNG|nr:hypothetical protein BCR42DRAFT_392790 [Absidia repens]